MATTPTKTGRNELCGCGSGLKVKRCHGNPAFQHAATNMAKGLVQLFVVQEMHEQDKLDADKCVEAVENITAQINKLLPECVNMETTFEQEDEEQEPVIDKLKQKEEEGGTLSDLQEGTYMCGCGRRLPIGMNCAKCSEKGN